FLRAMKIEQSDLRKARSDDDIGWIAGKARAGDAILHHIVSFDHDRRQSRSSAAAEELPLEKTLHADPSAPVAISDNLLLERRVLLLVAEARDGAAAPVKIRIETDGDDHPRIERAGGGDRYRVDQRAVDQPSLAHPHRRKHTWH